MHKKSTFYLNVLLFVTLSAILFQSCISLRYTDYGKPFDFLKAKNDFVKRQASSPISYLDTIQTSDLVSYSVNSTDSNYSAIYKPISNNDLEESTIQGVENQVLVQDSLIKPSKLTENSLILRDGLPFVKNKKTQPIVEGITEKKNFPWPDKWKESWRNFWSAVWRFFLKWLLIAVAILALIALIIYGIYLLVALIGGTLAAAITIVVLLLLLLIFTGIDLFFILDFL
jgi:uncharacterized membrane protein YraQ (UPF0718 family)